jgi:hypothetical protein
MLTSKERADRVASLFLGAAHEQREVLANLIQQELDEASAESVELVRNTRLYVSSGAVVASGDVAARAVVLQGIVDDFLRAHGVEVD